MKRAVLICLTLVTCGLSALAQTTAPTPPADDGEVVKISTNLIQLDVTITDKKGNPIRDIRPDEVEIYENGKKQEISFMTFVPGDQPQLAEGREVERAHGEPFVEVKVPSGASVQRDIAYGNEACGIDVPLFDTIAGV